MRVIPPLANNFAFTDAMITSSTATEPGTGETAWTAGATFAKNQYSIVGAPSLAVTITNASPGVVTWVAHGLPIGTPVMFTTTGALPAGLTANTLYYVLAPLTDTFQVSVTAAGVPIVTSSAGSGVHTATAYIHRTYISLQAANLNNSPMNDAALTTPLWWKDTGPTNKWAMFDLLRNTQTILPSPLTVVIAPGQRVNSVALLGLIANAVTISATSVTGGGSIYNSTTNLDARNVFDWYSYFFEPFSTNPSTVKFDIPPYSDVIITITLTANSGNVSCGACIIGTYVYIGDAEWNAVSDCINFSTVTRDAFGNSKLSPQRNVPKTTQRVFIDKARVNKVIALRDALNGKPAVFSGLDDPTDGFANALFILGIIKAAPISLDKPQFAHMNLELEEV